MGSDQQTGVRGRPSAGVCPRGLLGMLLLVSAIELHFAAHGLRYMSDQALSWKETARHAVSDARRCEILCFGDSLVKFGVLPKVVASSTRRNTFNLALLNGPPSASYLLLRRSLAAGARPKLAVVDFMPNQLVLDPRAEKYRRCWVELTGLRDGVALARDASDPEFVGWLAAETLLPSLRARDEIRSTVVAALAGRDNGFRHTARLLQRNWRENLGAQLAVRDRWDGAGDHLPDDAPLFRPWAANPAMVDYVERFLALAESHGIAVAWLLPPITRASPARREMLDPGYLQVVGRMLRRFPNLTVLDGRLSRYATSCYVDPVHLHPSGALALSADLAPRLDRIAAAPGQGLRWVKLADYRERAETDGTGSAASKEHGVILRR